MVRDIFAALSNIFHGVLFAKILNGFFKAVIAHTQPHSARVLKYTALIKPRFMCFYFAGQPVNPFRANVPFSFNGFQYSA